MKKKKYILICIILTTIVILGGGYLLFLKSKQSNDKTVIMKAVSEILVLPEGDPELMEVASEDVIKTQPFFKRAEVGDKVLVYMKEGTAILYSPKKHKIVNMGILRLDRDPQGIDTDLR